MTGVWRVKPGTAEMELDMSVQADSENFDTDVDLDKVMRKPPVANGYAVGILIRNEVFNGMNGVASVFYAIANWFKCLLNSCLF
ncbi:hypothetical protein HanPI659440_Chr10g0395151 [Helianthus annuus]|nr:hypothetical protein HanPI659440_Chr10g0395151 [Helianthus annuus]